MERRIFHKNQKEARSTNKVKPLIFLALEMIALFIVANVLFITTLPGYISLSIVIILFFSSIIRFKKVLHRIEKMTEKRLDTLKKHLLAQPKNRRSQFMRLKTM